MTINHIEHRPEHYLFEVDGEVVADAHLRPNNSYYFIIELVGGPTLGEGHNMSPGEALRILTWMENTLVRDPK